MHRDLKPQNILLHNGIVKLADFGFCRPLKSQDEMVHTMLGSPIYMAPEILRGFDYSAKADVWSLGVVLYEMLFGFCPFEEKSIAKLIMLLDNAELVIRKDINNISEETVDLLKNLIVKDPAKRYSW